MEVKTASLEDYNNWLNLAKEVEHLFGPMSEEQCFQDALRNIIKTKQAFCIKDNDNLCGGIAISKENNEIAWFVVSKNFQKNGLGKKLIKYALNQLDTKKDIIVRTFADNIPEGKAARHLYQIFGFKDFAPDEPTPANIPTIIMIRPKTSC